MNMAEDQAAAMAVTQDVLRRLDLQETAQQRITQVMQDMSAGDTNHSGTNT